MNTRDADFDAITEKEIFEEARDRLKICRDAETGNRNEAKYDIEFKEGLNHWDNKTYTSASMDQPELTINLTDVLVGRVVNNMKQQRPRGKCHPVGDGANADTAELIQGIGRHVEYRSEASVAYDTAGDLAVTAGWGYCRMVAEYIASDKFERDIRILPIFNIFSVDIDPSAEMPTACDMRYGFVSIQQKRTEYKRLHPKADNAAWTDGDSEYLGDWETKEEIRLAEYFRIRETSETLYLIRKADGTDYTRFKDELSSTESMLAAGDVIVNDRPSSRKQVEWFLLNGTKVIDREILPGEYIPIIRCAGNAANVDGKVIRRGMVRNMRDPQRMVDYGEVAKVKRLGLAPQAQWVAAEGQLDGHPEWADANTTAYPVLTYKPVTVTTAQGEAVLPPPQRQTPAQIEAGFSEMTEGMRSNLLAIAGAPNDPGQDTRGEVVSGIAQDKRQKLSDQSHYQYYDNQTLMIAHIWRIMLSWIPYYYKEPGRIQRIIGEDGQPRMETLNQKDPDPAVTKLKNDLSIGRYDIVMDTGPGYETRREEGAENMLQLMSIPQLAELVVKVGPDLLLRSIDHPYMQELADRIQALTPDGLKQVMEQLPPRAKAIVQSLSNQLQAAQQALQQAQMENKYGIAKAHLAAAVKAHDVEETNKTKRADTESRDQTKLQVTAMQVHGKLADTEIKTGGAILDTHVQAGHDAAAAERMIEASEKAESTNGAAK